LIFAVVCSTIADCGLDKRWRGAKWRDAGWQGLKEFTVSRHDESSVGDFTLMRLYRSCGLEDIGEEAAAKFTQRYLEKLVSLIDANMSAKLQAQFDAEDVAQSVLNSWFQGIRRRRISPQSSTEIWSLISVIALNKIRNRVRAFAAKKREGSRVRESGEIIENFPEPEPGDIIEMEDFIAALKQRLTPRSQRVLQLSLEGLSVKEIAEDLGVVTRTIQRCREELRKESLALLPEDLRETAMGMFQQADDEAEHRHSGV
jgi:RNA polymerase sigma factor (sigma-70 family)